MSEGTRYFTNDADGWPAIVEWDSGDGWESVGGTHILDDPTDVENSTATGYTEVDEAAYNAAYAQCIVDRDAAIAAETDALAAAAETAYDDLVANGISAAVATQLTGHTP